WSSARKRDADFVLFARHGRHGRALAADRARRRTRTGEARPRKWRAQIARLSEAQSQWPRADAAHRWRAGVRGGGAGVVPGRRLSDGGPRAGDRFAAAGALLPVAAAPGQHAATGLPQLVLS